MAKSVACQQCRQPLEPDGKFCGYCGAPAPDIDGPPAALDIPGEQQQWQYPASASGPDDKPPPSVGPAYGQTFPGFDPGPPDDVWWPGPPNNAAPESPPKADFTTLLGGSGAAALAGVRTGDWKGALLAVSGGLLSMGVPALVGTLLLGAPGVGGGVLLRLTGSEILLSVGGTIRVGQEGTEISVSALPLMLTLFGYGVMAFIFLRRLGSAPVAVARLQALRMLLVQLVAVLVLGLVAAGTLTVASSGSVHIGTNLFLTVVFSASWLAAVLLIASFVYRPDWLTPKLRAVREQLVGPLSGLLVAMAVALSVTAAVIMIVAIDYGHASYGLAAVLTYLPNLALAAITTGLGVPLHASGSASLAGFGGGTSTDVTLSQLGSLSAWFWLLPVFTCICLAAGGIAVALLAPDLPTARRDCLRLALTVPVALLVGSWVAALSASASANASFIGVAGAASVHPSYLPLVVVGAVAGAVAGGAGFLLAPYMPNEVTLLLTRITGPRHRSRADRGSAGPPGYRTPIRIGRRGRVSLVAVGLLLALLVAGSVLDQYLAKTTFGPRQAVARYLAEIARGDAVGALRELHGVPISSGLLTSPVLRKAVNGAQIHNIHLGTVTRRGDRATVSTTFDVGSQPGQQETFQLVADRAHEHLGRYPAWRIENPLAVLQIQSSGLLSTVTVNGVPVNLSSEGATLPALPGSYVIAVPDGGPVTADAQTVIITGTEGGTAVQLRPQLTSSAVSQVQQAVDAKIADCEKATVLTPPGCSFISASSFGTATHIVWRTPAPGNATQVQLDTSGVIAFSGAGTASVSYLEDAGFGTTPTSRTSSVSYFYSGTATFSSGVPQLVFS